MQRGADDDPYSDRPTKKPPNATGMVTCCRQRVCARPTISRLHGLSGDHPVCAPCEGGTALGGSYNAAAAAMAAVAQASALTGPRAVRCNVCSATFAGDADMQQHLQVRRPTQLVCSDGRTLDMCAVSLVNDASTPGETA